MVEGKTTRAVRFHEYGEPGVLAVDHIARPAANAGEVLVRVRAVGVHPMDWKLRAGHLQAYMPLQLPHVPGYEFAGVVEEVGDGVTQFASGDAVFGQGNATYAEHAAVPVSTLAKKPDSMSFEEAATLGLSGVTALRVIETADIHPGARVLIHGGAGGVGSIAVQLAHSKGAYVIATTSSANVEHVRALGADEVIDYNTTPFDAALTGIDIVIDTVGGDVLQRSWGVLKPGGLLITITAMPDAETANQHGVRTAGIAPLQDSSSVLSRLADLVTSGVIKPQVAEVFTFDDVAAAHASSQSGHGRGRRVIRVG